MSTVNKSVIVSLFFLFFFFQRTGLDISCDLSKVTIYMKFQTLFLGKKESYFKMLSAVN